MRIDHRELRGRIARLEEMYRSCRICPEACGVDRHRGDLGVCGLGASARVYKEFLHLGEEPEVGPSHVVYLAGCNFRCRYCSDLEPVLHPRRVDRSDPAWLARRVRLRREQGARTLTFVGGSPDVQPLFALQVLDHLDDPPPVVWNSNLWLVPETLRLLVGVVDLFVPDLKYGPGDCDARLSGVADTSTEILRLLALLKEAGEAVLVRHLLLPGHADCCTAPALEALSGLWPGLRVNLMTAYRPFALSGQAGVLGRPMGGAEAGRTVSAMVRRFGARLSLRVDGRPVDHGL